MNKNFFPEKIRLDDSKYGFSRIIEVFFEIVKINFFERGSNNFIYLTVGIGIILVALSFLVELNFIKNINLYFLLALLSFIVGLYLFVMASVLYSIRFLYNYYQKYRTLDKFSPEIINYERKNSLP